MGKSDYVFVLEISLSGNQVRNVQYWRQGAAQVRHDGGLIGDEVEMKGNRLVYITCVRNH